MEPEQKTKITLAENVFLTIKLLVMGALVMAAIWGIERWTSTR